MFENSATTGIKFNNLLSLKILEKLGNGLNFDFTALENLIVGSAQDTQTSIAALNTEIEELKTLVQNQQPATALTFTPLNLQPTYQSNSSHGWAVAPQNLQALYDADSSTASNLFEVAGGVAWANGEIILFPGVAIPQFTRINFKVGIRNNNNNRCMFELAAFNVGFSSYINLWSYFGNLSNTQDLIANIDVIIPYVWDKLRFKMWDTTSWAPQARFYDLKVWEVS